MPSRPSAAVLSGAVYYGLDPCIVSLCCSIPILFEINEAVISSRTVARTYGIRVTRQFQNGDPEDRKV